MTIPQESALNILHIDSSARPGLSGQDRPGSHSRRLSARLVRRWSSARPQDRIVHRDVGMAPSSHGDGEWTAAPRPDERLYGTVGVSTGMPRWCAASKKKKQH